MIERSRVRVPTGAARKVSSPGSTCCANSYFGIRSNPVLPQQRAGGRLRLNTHAPYVCGACFYGVHITCADTVAV